VKKVKVRNKNVGKTIFIILMLAYPIIRFSVFFIYVNIDSILLTFQRYSISAKGFTYAGFANYRQFFVDLQAPAGAHIRRMIINSLLYMPVTCFIILPLSMLFSYFLFKKIPMSGMFRVIYFLPSIISIVILTMVYKFIFDANLGPANSIFESLAKFFGAKDPKAPSWFGKYPNNQIMIFIYCIWAGLGFNILLLSGSIAKIPSELIEYGKLEGIGFFKEFTTVVVPLIWPTVVTTFMIGITSVFTVLLHPELLTKGIRETDTIARFIYRRADSSLDIPYIAAMGLTLSLIAMPFIILIRRFLNKFFREVEY